MKHLFLLTLPKHYSPCMIKKIAIVFICSLIFSCSTKTEVIIPTTVLPVEKMAAVLVDMHLLEASMNLNAYNPDKTVTEKPAPDFNVLKKNKISKKQYDESFDFYTRHPDLLNKIYEIVLSDLSKMQAEVTNRK
jgi:hypothetical protein